MEIGSRGFVSVRQAGDSGDRDKIEGCYPLEAGDKLTLAGAFGNVQGRAHLDLTVLLVPDGIVKVMRQPSDLFDWQNGVVAVDDTPFLTPFLARNN